MNLTKENFRGRKFNWSEKVKKYFNKLKKSLITTSILPYLDSLLSIIIKTNVTNFMIGTILSLLENGKLQPITFHSYKIDKSEIDHEICNKKILAIISIFIE
jgi:hypothetical protein